MLKGNSDKSVPSFFSLKKLPVKRSNTDKKKPISTTINISYLPLLQI